MTKTKGEMPDNGHAKWFLDRFLRGLRQGLDQVLHEMPDGPVMAKLPRLLRIPPNRAFAALESPRGQYAVYAVSDGSDQPFRFRIHDPSFFNLQAVAPLSKGHLLADIMAWTETFPEILDDLEGLLTENRIFKQRNVDIAVVSQDDAIAWGFSGPMIRAAGLPWDLRKSQPYDVYDRMQFDIPVGTNSDCYDRFVVRVKEVYESAKIIKQCLAEMPSGPVASTDSKVVPPKRGEMKQSMEALIHHFKLFTEGYCVPAGEAYAAVEHPKGEFGVYLVSDGANKPFRLKVRAPGFVHMSAMNEMVQGHMLADVVAVIGTMDIVFGEVDR